MGVNEAIGCRRGGEAWPQPLFLSRSRGKDPPPRGNRPCAPFAFLQSMRLPRRVEDAAELRKVGAGDTNSWQVGWAMAVFLTVVSAPSRSPAEPKAAAGEAPARADQREPKPAEGSRIAAAGRGDFPLFEVGEGRHPGNDCALPTGAACDPVLLCSTW